jgi:hypothetical protein
MKKRTSMAFGKKQFLIGSDKSGILYWLEESKLSCDWYWSVGWIQTFTANNNPKVSRDINSLMHFDSMMERTGKNWFDGFRETFKESVLTDKELWVFAELMKSLYTVNEYAELVYRGCSNYTTNPSEIIIKNMEEYNRINNVVIPAILSNIYSLLSPKSEIV